MNFLNNINLFDPNKLSLEVLKVIGKAVLR